MPTNDEDVSCDGVQLHVSSGAPFAVDSARISCNVPDESYRLSDTSPHACAEPRAAHCTAVSTSKTTAPPSPGEVSSMKLPVGPGEGTFVGICDGKGVGAGDGSWLGMGDGKSVGDGVGDALGSKHVRRKTTISLTTSSGSLPSVYSE